MMSAAAAIFCSKVCLSALASGLMGLVIVNLLRVLSIYTEKKWKLLSIVYAFPISIFIILHVAASINAVNRVVVDSFSFGIVIGILYGLSQPCDNVFFRISSIIVRKVNLSYQDEGMNKNKSAVPIKIIAVISSTKHIETWFYNYSVTVYELKSRLADILNIPRNQIARVVLENGKGECLDSLVDKVIPQVQTTEKNDFFGFFCYSLYVTVAEDEDKMLRGGAVSDLTDGDEDAVTDGKGKKFEDVYDKLFSLIESKREIIWDEPVTLNCQVFLEDFESSTYASSEPDKKNMRNSLDKKLAKFMVAPKDKFCTGTILTSIMPLSNVRLRYWDKKKEAIIDSSKLGGLEGSHGSAESLGAASEGSSPRRHSGGGDSSSNIVAASAAETSDRKVIRNHDVVQIVSMEGDKYMNITNGWWVSWSSDVPKRSGAFVIEITEKKSTQNIHKQNLKKLSNFFQAKRLNGDDDDKGDNILRTGDSFVLRSLKYPDFELGLTSEQLTSSPSHCYVGLRRSTIGGAMATTKESKWCQEVRFRVKKNSVIVSETRSIINNIKNLGKKE